MPKSDSVVSRYRKARRLLKELHPDDLRKLIKSNSTFGRIMEVLALDSASTIAICAATYLEIKTIAGVALANICKTSYSLDTSLVWDLQSINNIEGLSLSNTFKDQQARLLKYFGAGCEAFSRSLIDVCVAEAWTHCPVAEAGTAPLRFFGEISVNMTDPVSKLTLSGFGDYFLAFADAEELAVENVILVIEAKNVRGGVLEESSVKQLFTYMAIIRCARVKANKEQPVVFGILTDSICWTFCYLDRNGVPRRSLLVQDTSCAIRHLVFVLSAAMSASPTTTPFSSKEALNEGLGGSLRSLTDIAGFAPVCGKQQEDGEPIDDGNFEIVLSHGDEELSEDEN